MASLDLQGSSLFACPSGWRVPCSLSLMCVPLPAWTSLVLCFVPSATHCPMTIHVATENGWESKPRVWEEVTGEMNFPLPSPPPKHTQKYSSRVGREQASTVPAVGRERELGITPLDQIAHPHISHLGAVARPRAG